jgi:hypothetical protein
MKRRDIVIGIVLLIFLGGVLYYRNLKLSSELNKVPEAVSVEQNIENKFNIQIPEDLDKAELKDALGGSSSGIVTKEYANGKYSSAVLVDLPSPEKGTIYQAWLEKGEKGNKDYQLVSLGKLNVAKGGWMLNFQSKTNYSSFNKVLVSQEKSFDKTPEKIVLQGSF